MSAFIVSDFHIAYILSSFDGHNGRSTIYGSDNKNVSFNLLTPEGFEEAANILLAQNYRSVSSLLKMSRFVPLTKWNRIPLSKTEPIQALKACGCYDYQSCETQDYWQTLACEIIQAIRLTNIHRLAGYDKAEWEIKEPSRISTQGAV